MKTNYFRVLFICLNIIPHTVFAQKSTLTPNDIATIHKELTSKRLIENSITEKLDFSVPCNRKVYFETIKKIIDEQIPQPLKQVFDNLPPTLPKTTSSYWSVPLPNTYGSTWIKLPTKNTGNKKAKAIITVYRNYQVLNRGEAKTLKKRLRTLYIPHITVLLKEILTTI